MPDLAITSLTDVLTEVRRLTDACSLPLLVDVDTGFGGVFSIARLVKGLIKDGAAAMHLEDQVQLKLCGHRPNKAVVSTGEMVDRLKSAVDARTDPEFFIIARTDALAVARANLAGAGTTATRVRIAEGSWFDALPDELRGSLRVVVSNPPYVSEPEVADLPPDVAWHEPREALVSGPSGLEAIEEILRAAPEWLEPSGVVVLELDPRRFDAAKEIARDAGFGEVDAVDDLTGRTRVLVARR